MVVAIVQARMGSSRLPGKVLRELAGRPLLAQQLRRLRRCAALDDIVVATTVNSSDDPIVDLARQEGARWFRGDETDVLSRFVGAAREARAEVIVRITSDCPLIDPEVTDRVVHELTGHRSHCDYASNVVQRTFPRGLDSEALFWDVLLRIDRLGVSVPAREHVTIVPRSERPDRFLCRTVLDSADNSDLRWTVDTERDLGMIQTIYEGLDLADRYAPYAEVLAFVRARPELAQLNAAVETWSPT